MKTNEELITHFYSSFKRGDVKAMQECYADNATFNDPIFKGLNAEQVRYMWAMLIKSGKDMQIELKNVKANARGATAEWHAQYTFSITGNKVINRVKANFIIENGKIAQHKDVFNFHKWARQALGFSGLLLGWTDFLRNKISKQANRNLEKFMRQSS